MVLSGDTQNGMQGYDRTNRAALIINFLCSSVRLSLHEYCTRKLVISIAVLYRAFLPLPLRNIFLGRVTYSIAKITRRASGVYESASQTKRNFRAHKQEENVLCIRTCLHKIVSVKTGIEMSKV